MRHVRPATLTAGVPASNLLAELTNALPTGASLVALSTDPVPRPQPATVIPTAFELKKAALESGAQRHCRTDARKPRPTWSSSFSGLAQSNSEVCQYCERLSQSRFSKGVRLLASEIVATPGGPQNNHAPFPDRSAAEFHRRPDVPGANSTTASIADPGDSHGDIRSKERNETIQARVFYRGSRNSTAGRNPFFSDPSGQPTARCPANRCRSKARRPGTN